MNSSEFKTLVSQAIHDAWCNETCLVSKNLYIKYTAETHICIFDRYAGVADVCGFTFMHYDNKIMIEYVIEIQDIENEPPYYERVLQVSFDDNKFKTWCTTSNLKQLLQITHKMSDIMYRLLYAKSDVEDLKIEWHNNKLELDLLCI